MLYVIGSYHLKEPADVDERYIFYKRLDCYYAKNRPMHL